jgi:hypothetical protein
MVIRSVDKKTFFFPKKKKIESRVQRIIKDLGEIDLISKEKASRYQDLDDQAF